MYATFLYFMTFIFALKDGMTNIQLMKTYWSIIFITLQMGREIALIGISVKTILDSQILFDSELQVVLDNSFSIYAVVSLLIYIFSFSFKIIQAIIFVW